MLGVLLAGACTSMNMHIPRGTSLTWRISDPHHPMQGEGVSPQVECTHIVRLYRLCRALGIVCVRVCVCVCGCYYHWGSLRGLTPSVNPGGNNIHTHTHTHPPYD